MSENLTYQSDSCDDLLDLSRANAQAVIIATAAFLDDAGVSAEAWVAYLGEVFARSWDASLELTAGEFLDAMLTNYRSLGAEVLTADLDDDRAVATIAGFPKRELCSELGVDCGLNEPYFAAPVALAEAQGLNWSWKVDGPRTVLTVSGLRDG